MTIAEFATHAYFTMCAADSMVSWFDVFDAADHSCRLTVTSHIPLNIVPLACDAACQPGCNHSP